MTCVATQRACPGQQVKQIPLMGLLMARIVLRRLACCLWLLFVSTRRPPKEILPPGKTVYRESALAEDSSLLQTHSAGESPHGLCDYTDFGGTSPANFLNVIALRLMGSDARTLDSTPKHDKLRVLASPQGNARYAAWTDCDSMRCC